MHGRNLELRREGFVSLWVGTFPSVEAAEAYFGIPDEIGVYLPPESFARDFGLGDPPAETLEVNFEQVLPRPLGELLADATFSASFMDQAIAAAACQGIAQAQGIALLYGVDYRNKPDWIEAAGPLRFVGAFPFIPVSRTANLQPILDVARKCRYPIGAVLWINQAIAQLTRSRREGPGDESAHVSARELCDQLLRCRGEDSTAILRELGLRRSEDVGRIIFAMIDAGLVHRRETEHETDFAGLFALG